MERLTKRSGDGGIVFPEELVGVTLTPDNRTMYKLLCRLAAYEDTELTPEEINDLASVREISPEAEYAISKHAENIIERLDKLLHQTDDDARLRELAKADKDGRVVVLPCKVSDTVYLIVTKRARTYTPEFRFIKKSRLTFLNMERVLQDFGKTVFLTREEAEKALGAMKDD
mgnify:CR=1 FL=1